MIAFIIKVIVEIAAAHKFSFKVSQRYDRSRETNLH